MYQIHTFHSEQDAAKWLETHDDRVVSLKEKNGQFTLVADAGEHDEADSAEVLAEIEEANER